jgi:SAM-dependent methyltransferase
MSDDFSAIMGISDGYAASRTLQAAVNLGLFEVVGDEGVTAEEAARRSGTDPRGVELLLNALAALMLLEKKGEVFRLTQASRMYLVPDSPKALAGMIRFDSRLWEVWGGLEETVRTGRPAQRTEMFQSDPGETSLFIEAMDSLVRARGDAEYLARNLRFDGVRKLLDIGSGPGSYPIAFCRAHPPLKAAIFDLPGTLEVTGRFVREAGLDDRIDLLPGDYNRDPLPGGFDLVFLSNIIHGENESRNRQLIRKIHGALRPGGRVMIKDHILDETMTRPAAGAIFSILMLLTNEGRDYAFHEVREWLSGAGFGDVREEVLPPPMTSSLVSAVK